MEPWQQEEQRQLAYTARVMRRPRCVCCDEHIWTERYVNLEPFGLKGYACEECIDKHFGYTVENFDY